MLLVKILYSDARATVGHVSDSGPTIEVSCSASDEVSRIEKRSKLIGYSKSVASTVFRDVIACLIKVLRGNP